MGIIIALLFLLIELYIFLLIVLVPRKFNVWLSWATNYRKRVQFRLANLAQACDRIKVYIKRHTFRSHRYLQYYHLVQSRYEVANKIRYRIIHYLRSWEFLRHDESNLQQLTNVSFAMMAFNSVLSGFLRLIWCDVRIQQAMPKIKKAQKSIAKMDALPVILFKESHKLKNETISSSKEIINTETSKQIQMDDYLQSLAQLEKRIAELAQLFSTHKRTSLRNLDHATSHFDNIKILVIKKERELKEIQLARMKLDKLMLNSSKNYQLLCNIFSEIPQANLHYEWYKHLKQQVSTLFEEVRRQRQERHFTEANQKIQLIEKKITLGKIITQLQPIIDYLDKEKTYSLRLRKINKAQDKFLLLSQDTLNLQINSELDALKKKLDKLKKEVHLLNATHREDIVKLEQQQDEGFNKLKNNWSLLRCIAVLSEDPLAQEYSRIKEDYTFVKGKPKLLDKFNKQVRSLSKEIENAYKYTQKILVCAERILQELEPKVGLAQVKYLAVFDNVTATLLEINNFYDIEQIYGEIQAKCAFFNESFTSITEDLQNLSLKQEDIEKESHGWACQEIDLDILQSKIRRISKKLFTVKELIKPDMVEAALKNRQIEMNQGWRRVQALEQQLAELNLLKRQVFSSCKSIENTFHLAKEKNEGWAYLETYIGNMQLDYKPYEAILTEMKHQRSIFSVKQIAEPLVEKGQVIRDSINEILKFHSATKVRYQRCEKSIDGTEQQVKRAKEELNEWLYIQYGIRHLEGRIEQAKTKLKELKNIEHDSHVVESELGKLDNKIDSVNKSCEKLYEDHQEFNEIVNYIRKIFLAINEQDWGSLKNKVDKRITYLKSWLKDVYAVEHKVGVRDQLLSIQESTLEIFGQLGQSDTIYNFDIDNAHGFNVGSGGQVGQNFYDGSYAN